MRSPQWFPAVGIVRKVIPIAEKEPRRATCEASCLRALRDAGASPAGVLFHQPLALRGSTMAFSRGRLTGIGAADPRLDLMIGSSCPTRKFGLHDGRYREKAPDSEGIADVSPCPRSANDFTHLAARYRTALIRVHGWAFAVDPPLSFDRCRALTGSARQRCPLPALWPRRLFHLVSIKTA